MILFLIKIVLITFLFSKYFFVFKFFCINWFKVFSSAANIQNGRVAALRIPKGAELSRSEIDTYTEFVKIYGAKGLAYIKINDKNLLNDEGLQSPIVKNIHTEALKA